MNYFKGNPRYKKFEEKTGALNPEWAEHLFEYVILGLPPGSFHTAVLSNDLYRAAATSHPLNQWCDIMACCLWLMNYAPVDCFGSKEKVNAWLALTPDERNEICEKARLLNTAWELLKS